jgi:hypothetical protein
MKKNIGQLTGEVYALLEGQEKEESIKILASVATLLGIDVPKTSFNQQGANNTGNNNNNGATNATNNNAKKYFGDKAPNNKSEEFAVAAKFRVDTGAGESHSKEDLKAIIKTQAKRTFDDKNFSRDIDNARKGKFFIPGDAKGEYILSDVGEKYVDALPDRAAAAETKKAVKGTKKSRKKVVKKK